MSELCDALFPPFLGGALVGRGMYNTLILLNLPIESKLQHFTFTDRLKTTPFYFCWSSQNHSSLLFPMDSKPHNFSFANQVKTTI